MTNKAATPAGLKGRLADQAGGSMTTGAQRPKTLADQINALVPQMTRLLNSEARADRMARIALTEFRKNPKLGECDPATFFGALLTATQLGLEPGPLGHAYLIPYRQQVTLQIGYRGLLELVSRADRVDSVFAYAVYEGDKFEYRLGASPDIHHVPAGETDDAKLTHVYAVAHIKGSSVPRLEVMLRSQVDAIRARSQSDMAAKKYDKQTPWDTDYAEMARKTVLKRLCKTLPLASQVLEAVAMDETVRAGLDAEDVTPMFDVPAAPAEAKDVTPPATETPEAAKPARGKPAGKTVDAAVENPPQEEAATHPANGGDGLFE